MPQQKERENLTDCGARMIAAADCHYGTHAAMAGIVLFEDWISDRATRELVESCAEFEEYQPGSFYKREAPCLLQLLGRVRGCFDVLIIDGYVWLGPDNKPGLGAHLYNALDESVPVIGVAKRAFRGASNAERVFRGNSRRPLYVTAAGMSSEHAAANVSRMHGPFRIPTILRRVDRLCRTACLEP
ncbi:MAG: endonuclease V [Desulfomonilaceae bacterium]|nr:endonuclease V [Desulfomonilaceae bacterium]